MDKNNLLRIASVLIIVCALASIIISVVNINKSLSSMTDLSAEEQAAVEAQMNEAGITMDQGMGLVSGIAYVGLAFIVVFNAIKIIIGIMGFLKSDKAYKFYTVWGIILIIFGVLGLTGGIFTLAGICNLIAGIVAPILYIIGGSQNKKRLSQ